MGFDRNFVELEDQFGECCHLNTLLVHARSLDSSDNLEFGSEVSSMCLLSQGQAGDSDMPLRVLSSELVGFGEFAIYALFWAA